jgi:hypothetical protein
MTCRFGGGLGRGRTADLPIFSRSFGDRRQGSALSGLLLPVGVNRSSNLDFRQRLKGPCCRAAREGGARRIRAAVSHCCWGSRCITCAGSRSTTWCRTRHRSDCGSHRSRILNSLTPEGVMVSAHGPAPNFVACRSSRVSCCLNMAAKSAGEWSCFPPIHTEQRPCSR